MLLYHIPFVYQFTHSPLSFFHSLIYMSLNPQYSPLLTVSWFFASLFTETMESTKENGPMYALLNALIHLEQTDHSLLLTWANYLCSLLRQTSIFELSLIPFFPVQAVSPENGFLCHKFSMLILLDLIST